MPGKNRRHRKCNGSAGGNAVRLLGGWREKVLAKYGKNILDVLERGCESESPLRYEPTDTGRLAEVQAIRAHQALKRDFGLPLGIAAPEVIVLSLYPKGEPAVLEAFRVAFAVLARTDGGVQPDEIEDALEGKFWTIGGGGFSPLTRVAAIDLRQIYRQNGEFHKESQSVFVTQPSLPTISGVGAPLLVILGLFPIWVGKNHSNDIPDVSLVVSPQAIKPFTRHDQSMSIFNFVEEMLLACGQGLVSVAAPAELSHVPEAVGVRKRWIKGLDRIYVDAMADAALYQFVKLRRNKTPGHVRGEGAAVLYKQAAPHRGAPAVSLPTSFENADKHYHAASPAAINKYSLIPPRVSDEYRSWISCADIARAEPANGIMEKRGGALIDIDGEVLERRMRAYLERDLSWRDYMKVNEALTAAQSGFNPEKVRKSILQQAGYNHQNIKPYAVKPFDNRYCYYSPVTPLWNDPRPDLARQCCPGNRFFVTRPAAAIEPEGVPFFLTDCLTDGDLLRGHAYCIPFCLNSDDGQRPRPNLSRAVQDYLRRLRLLDAREPERQAELIWWHVLAIGFSPAYLAANAEALQQSWPRIPFPMPAASERDASAASALLLHSAALGEKLAALLAPDKDLSVLFTDVDANLCAEIAPLYSSGDGTREMKPFACDSIALNANWGYTKVRRKKQGEEPKQGVDQEGEPESGRNVMPGSGRLFRRNYDNRERRALEDMGLGMGLHAGAVYAALGHDTCDIFLDRDVFWRNVPSNVWEYRIGGYPVLKKWLSYRERAILGRDLRYEEVQYFTAMVRRLAMLRLLESELDRNFAHIRDRAGDPTKQGKD